MERLSSRHQRTTFGFRGLLIGTPVIDPRLPLEIIRTIHSFDPCMACAVHLYDENGEHIHDVKCYNINPQAIDI